MAEAKAAPTAQGETAPPAVKEEEKTVQAPETPEFVMVKNISKNSIGGRDGMILPGSEGEITFADFCNFSPTYVTAV